MELLVKSLAGSRLYGLDNPDSDVDYSCIYMPSLDQLLLGDAPDLLDLSTSDYTRKNKGDDVDNLVYSLKYFIEMACNGKQQVIDMLHANAKTTSVTSDIWTELQANRSQFYSKTMSSSVSFVAKQIALYGDGERGKEAMLKLETVLYNFTKEGLSAKIYEIADQLPITDYSYFVTCDVDGNNTVVDWADYADHQRNVFYRVDGGLIEVSLSVNQLYKHTLDKIQKRAKDTRNLIAANKGQLINWKEVSHAMRVGYQFLSILTEGDYEYPLPQSDFLREIKSGTLDFRTHVEPLAEQLIADINKLMFTTTLPTAIDVEYWQQWLLRVYCAHYNIFASRRHS